MIAALSLAVLVVAVLYSSVGHAGASGYIAVMSLFNVSPTQIKPTALALNIIAASLTAWRFRREGHFSWPLFWPFALLSVPCALIGGYVDLPTHFFKVLVGLVLLGSALRLLISPPAETEPTAPARATAVGVGAGLGLLAGLTGTGGGIFLTPTLIFMGWAKTKTAAGVSAMFILVNSIAGLIGHWGATRRLPGLAWPLAIAVVCGAAAGSHLGSAKLPQTAIKRLLAAVLLIAGGKLIFVS